MTNSKSKALKSPARGPSRYAAIIEEVFKRHYKKGVRAFEFDRKDFKGIAEQLGIALPDNLGDLTYSFKYRTKLPDSIAKTAPKGFEWNIVGAGISKYQFKLVKPLDISPRESLLVIKIPDATPEIIGAYALGDEQALLAKVRYNRLIDLFLGVTASSLQNHLRTTVRGIGQIEIDELYVGIDRSGSQYVIPVQAKGGNDRHGRQQTEQDMACCGEKFPLLRCRPVSAQFMAKGRIAMFELAMQDGDVKVVAEEHYQLVPAAEITSEDLDVYRTKKL